MMTMEKKCKNCMCFYPNHAHGDGSKGTCGQSGELVVHDREDKCDCACYMELPKKEKIIRTINKVLKPWIRERDDMFRRSMELVAHISQLFENGEFKVFDAVKATAELKGLVFFGKDTLHSIERVWTYHCPWDDDKEHFIALTVDGKMVMNTWDDRQFGGSFETTWIDIETQFEDCMYAIDRIRDNCIMKTWVMPPIESEEHKCVSDDWRTAAETHPINKEDTIIRYPR